jgi:uncharacterized membrane protein
MAADPAAAWAAILGMALATYLTRVAGPLLLARMTLSPRLTALLTAMPGAILVSIVLPGLAHGGPAEWLAALAAAGVAARTRKLLLAMLAGVGVVLLLRHLIST